MEKGSSLQLNADVIGENYPQQTVTWSVIGGTAGTRISVNGLLSVAPDEIADSLTVKATSTIDPSKSGTSTVTLVTKYLVNISGGRLEGVDNRYLPGTILTVTSSRAPTGYRFKEWNAQGLPEQTYNDDPLTFEMPENEVSLSAEFELIPPPEQLTGMAVISNTSPLYGDTLTASLVDSNNIGILSYQWWSDENEVGINSNTYTLQLSDIGKRIKVTITSDYETGSVTSEETEIVSSTLPLELQDIDVSRIVDFPLNKPQSDDLWYPENYGHSFVDDPLSSLGKAIRTETMKNYQWGMNKGSAEYYLVNSWHNFGVLFMGLPNPPYDWGNLAVPVLTPTAISGMTDFENQYNLFKAENVMVPSESFTKISFYGDQSVSINDASHKLSKLKGKLVDVYLSVRIEGDFAKESLNDVVIPPTYYIDRLIFVKQAEPLTGTATISNTEPKYNDTLTADLIDGNNTGELSYEWKSGSDIVGTNSNTYTVTQTDIGKKITVTISSNVETGSITSAETAEVANIVIPIPSTESDNIPFEVIVDGKREILGTSKTTNVNDKLLTVITLDSSKVEEKLQNEGNNAVVTISLNNGTDVVIEELSAQIVKMMGTKGAVLEVKTDNVTYKLPASQIDMDKALSQFGNNAELKDISLNIKISEAAQDSVSMVEDAANKGGYQIVVKPIEFVITCNYGDSTVELSKFNGYVERIIAIPEDIDPDKVTTGIVLNSDGTFSQVPTKIIFVDSKYYANINSLTNSIYSVIWSSKEFIDVESHWAKEAVNDMGSRLIISGIGEGIFEPDRDITRGEFAAIVVRALGIMRAGTGKDAFSDVTKDAWYYDAVSIANEYGIISGYGNGKFGPTDNISREEAMSIIERAMVITGLKEELEDSEVNKLLETFGDSGEAANWAKNSIASCIQAEIVSGRDGKIIAPKDNIIRAEVAVIVRRLLQKSELI